MVPIGMFDSGFGGLTVARAVIDLVPGSDLVYFGDTARYPYGSKPLDEVHGYAMEIGELLVDRFGIGLLVVACNTAAAVAIDDLRSALDIPVLGVIEPGLRASVAVSRSGRIGVIGTVGTVSSGAYQTAYDALGAPGQLVTASCPGFVEFVERGETEGEQVSILAERLLAPVVDAKVDTLLLGCTHYPYLARVIGDVMGRDVVLVSSADETAFDVRARLVTDEEPPGRPGTVQFLSSGDPLLFRELGRRLLGPELDAVESHAW